jgi:hypothetical protein
VSAQTSVSCSVERRLRALKTMNASDIHHAAKALSRLPDSQRRRAVLEDAQHQKAFLHNEADRHRASCETCFKSGASL